MLYASSAQLPQRPQGIKYRFDIHQRYSVLLLSPEKALQNQSIYWKSSKSPKFIILIMILMSV